MDGDGEDEDGIISDNYENFDDESEMEEKSQKSINSNNRLGGLKCVQNYRLTKKSSGNVKLEKEMPSDKKKC